VFDHTSILQFLEKFVSLKSGKQVKETNITEWRRTICGDLTSTFTPYDGQEIKLPTFLEREEFMESIFNAKFKKLPNGYKALSKSEIEEVNKNPLGSPILPSQEKGTRPACAIPYELYADGAFNAAKNAFEIKLEARNDIFHDKSAGSPFIIYAPGKYKNEEFKVWNYAVKAGDAIHCAWNPADFEDAKYHLRVYGPNGFFREYAGKKEQHDIRFRTRLELDKNKKPTGNIHLDIDNISSTKEYRVTVKDNVYGAENQTVTIQKKNKEVVKGRVVTVNASKNANWYDFSIVVEGEPDLIIRHAGHVETGAVSESDPYMGQMIS